MRSISKNLLQCSFCIPLMLMQSRKASCGRTVFPLPAESKRCSTYHYSLYISGSIHHLKSETPYVLEIYGVLIHDMTIIFADPIP